MRTLTIAVPSYADIKADLVAAKDSAVDCAKLVAAHPKETAVALGNQAKKPTFIVGVCAGLVAALAIKNMVS